MKRGWKIKAAAVGALLIGLVLYTAPMWIQKLGIGDPVQFLMTGNYQVRRIEIWGQRAEVLCTNAKVLQFFESIFPNQNVGSAPGPPNGWKKGWVYYTIGIYCSGRRYIQLAVWFGKDGKMLLLSNPYSDDDKMYWFQIPKKRPKEFERCLKFLLDEENAWKTLVIE